MGLTKRKAQTAGISITLKKLELLISEFLTEHEADMTADFRPQEAVWRDLLAQAIAHHVMARIKIDDV